MENLFTLNYSKLKKVAKKNFEKLQEIKRDKDIIMGADLSSHSSGIAIINKKKELLFMDKIFIKNYDKTSEEIRILSFVIAIKKIIQVYNPSVVVVEQIFSKNIETHKNLARLHGIFSYLMIMHNIEVKYIHPSSAKAYLGCKTKEEVFEKLNMQYKLGLNFKEHNDGVDALLMALNYYNKEKLK